MAKTKSEPTQKEKRAVTKRVNHRLAGAALAAAVRVQARVELPRLRGESPVGHRAFLLWAMAGGLTYPNQRALLDTCAAAVQMSASNFRLDAKNKRFAQRIQGHAYPDQVAYATYRRLYLLDYTGRELLGVAAALDPPPDAIPELWRFTPERLAEDIEARRVERLATRKEQFAAAMAEARPIGDVPNRVDPRRPINLDSVKPADTGKVIARLVNGDVSDVVSAGAETTRGAKLDARQRAKEAVIRTAERVAKHEKKSGERVILTEQDAKNVLRSILGTPIDERTLRQVDRDLLAAARAAGPDAEVRLLSLLATQRAEAEAAAADPNDRLLKLVDASFGYFANALKNNQVKVTMSSLPMLIKARALLTGGATARTEHTGLLDARGLGLRDSARVKDARESKDTNALIRAMREDVAELSVILDALGDTSVDDEAPTVIEGEATPVTSAAGE